MINAAMRRQRMHYGWWIAGGGFLTQIILVIALQALPINLSVVIPALQITTGQAGMIVSVYGLFYAGTSFVWGSLADKVGPRLTVTIASAVASLGLILFGAVANSLTTAMLCYAVAGFGVAGIYTATMPKLIGAWFVASKRGKAMTVVTVGGSIAGMSIGIVIPLMTGRYGWRTCFLILGCVALAFSLCLYAIVRNKPSDKGLLRVGATDEDRVIEEAKVAKGKSDKRNKYVVVMKQMITWKLIIAFDLYQLAFMIDTTFTALTVVRGGFTALEGGIAVTVGSIATTIGMFFWGPLCDRMERKNAMALACLWWAVFALVYPFVWATHSLPAILAIVFVMNLGQGTMPVVLSLFSDYYPQDIRGTANGFISSVGLFGRFLGPVIAGLLVDATGVFSSVYVFEGVAIALAAVAAFALPNLRKTNMPRECPPTDEAIFPMD